MNKLRNALGLSFLMCSLFTLPAFAGVRVSLVGVGNLPMPSVTANLGGVAYPAPTGKFGFGGGALLEVPMGPKLGLELGGLYYQRKYDIDFTSLGGGLVSYNFPTVEIPLTLNIHFNRFISLNLGGYMTAAAGAGTESMGGVEQSATVSDVNQRPINYGVLGGLGLNLPLGNTAAFRAEGRYHLALQNSFDADTIAADATNSWKQNELQIYAGITFGGGAK